MSFVICFTIEGKETCFPIPVLINRDLFDPPRPLQNGMLQPIAFQWLEMPDNPDLDASVHDLAVLSNAHTLLDALQDQDVATRLHAAITEAAQVAVERLPLQAKLQEVSRRRPTAS